ncbi:MAG: flotillin-like protein FloA [Planctomycetota bacterium]|nr:flotillin-like protein FloA [Planctomycetota bacterium]MEC8161020.1 flotillin-like protein FloA [Planctomycetota bacterium]MEC9115341.1 flotillin-like protein FloA [Planctomycetota bacterium]
MLFPYAASLIAQQGPNPGNILLLGLLVVGLLIVVAFIGVFAAFFRWWIQSVLTGAGIGLLDLLGMTFRKVKPAVIVRGMIMARQANIQDPELKTDALEAHYLAGGNVPLVIRALIAANKAKTISLTFREATAIDLAGRNVLEAVQTSVYPRVIDCPAKDDARKSLDAVAKDGIQLKVRARVTVRANLQQLIGGAAEETIMARVGEGIVSSIGSSESHKKVLENPDMISKNVLARRLDSQTAFEIVSIDIADIDVGSNIGARLQADQAEADTRVARARAEGRRANAIASEQENVATIEESRAKLVDAESEVPRAISEAFRTGKLGVLEYYKLRNLQADTEMRKSISNVGNQSPSPAT